MKKIIIILVLILGLFSCEKRDLIDEYSKKYIEVLDKEIKFLENNNLIYKKIDGVKLEEQTTTKDKLVIEKYKNTNLFCNNKKDCVLVFGDSESYRNDNIYEDKKNFEKGIDKFLGELYNTYYDGNNNMFGINLKAQFKTVKEYFKENLKIHNQRTKDSINYNNYLLNQKETISIKECDKLKELYISTKTKKEIDEYLKDKIYIKYSSKNSISSLYDCNDNDGDLNMFNFNDMLNFDDRFVFKFKNDIYFIRTQFFVIKDDIFKSLGLKLSKNKVNKKNVLNNVSINEKLITDKSTGNHPEISLNGKKICYSKSVIINKKENNSFLSDEKYIYDYNSEIFINDNKIIDIKPGKLVSCKIDNGNFIMYTYNGKTKQNNMYLENNKNNVMTNPDKIVKKLFSTIVSPNNIINKDGNFLVSYTKEGNYLRFPNNDIYYLKGKELNSISMYYNEKNKEGKILYSTKEGLEGFNSLYLIKFNLK